MSIYNDLVRTSFPDASKERLDEIYSNSSDALSGILTGLESVGNLMFWATDNDSCNYSEEMAANDLRNIGDMLMNIMPIARTLQDNSANARAQLRTMERRAGNKLPVKDSDEQNSN